MTQPTGEVNRFWSWGEFVAACNRPADPSITSTPASKKPSYGNEWDQGVEWDAAVKLASYGWPDGVRQFGLVADQIVSRVAEQMEFARFKPDDSEGLFCDVTLALAGESDYWFKRDPDFTTSDAITIVMNATASAAVSADVMIARGAAVAALATLLETEGRAVQVWLAYSVQASEHITTIVEVKSFKDRAEPSILAYALAHPTAFRRLYFAFQESRKDSASRFDCGSGYGYPDEVDASLLPEGALYIGKAYAGEAQWQTAETAAEWVKGELAKFGVEVQS